MVVLGKDMIDIVGIHTGKRGVRARKDEVGLRDNGKREV